MHMPFAARLHRRGPEAVDPFGFIGRGAGGGRWQTKGKSDQAEEEYWDARICFH
jgi:hypothetical protein